jgi:serine/threonine protein kinase
MFKPYTRAQVEFESIQNIGEEGQNSTTHLCNDPQLDANIVVKKIVKQKLEEGLYFSEAQVLYKSAHPNVVPILYACQDDDSVYIAMPFFEGGSLKSLISNRFLTVREIVSMGCQMLSGLHNIHSKRLVHFDIKPDNILISNRGEASISDFGLAKAIAANGTAEQDRFYFKNKPPEALAGGYEFGLTFDIYQFGLTLYRMCNGDREFYQQFESFIDDNGAFNRDNFLFAVRNARFPTRDTFLPHIPDRLRRVCIRCLSPDPNDRFSSAIEISNEIARIDTTYMDWVYNPIDDCHSWEKNVEGTKYEFTIAEDGRTEMTKSVNGGDARRVTEFCTDGMTDHKVKLALGKV